MDVVSRLHAQEYSSSLCAVHNALFLQGLGMQGFLRSEPVEVEFKSLVDPKSKPEDNQLSAKQFQRIIVFFKI